MAHLVQGAERVTATPTDQLSWLFRAGADLHRKGDLDRAQMAFERLLVLAPHHAQAAHSLGFIAMQRGDFEAALKFYDRALADGLDSAELHNNRGMALRFFGREVEAVESLRQAVSPRFAQAWRNLGASLLGSGDLPAALSALRQALEIEPNMVAARSIAIFAENYLPDVDAAILRRDAEAFCSAISQGLAAPGAFTNDPDPARPIRVGLVSADFRTHAVTRFLLAPLSAWTSPIVEFHAYSTGDRSDDTTERLKTLFSSWTDIQAMSDEAAAQRISSDQIDILIDLSGYTEGNRLPLFARKPAPVGVTWLGYSGTTGIGSIDYVLADATVLPPSEEADFSEMPWRLPDSYLCYTPPAEFPEVAALPARSTGSITFGSFNNLNKISDSTIALWTRVVQAVPRSRLVLKGSGLASTALRKRLADRFKAAGHDAERLVLLDYVKTDQDHLAAYGQIDIALDPFPYNGTTTTCEALLMGVPVVVLKGGRFIAHVGETILKSTGLSEWIAEDEAAYVEIARRAAANLDALEALRRQLRQQFLSSPMCDAPRFAHNFEDALRGMWRAWCAAQGRT